MPAWWFKHPGAIRQTYGQIIVAGPAMIAAWFFVLAADLETLRIFGGFIVAFKVFDLIAETIRTEPLKL